MVLTQPSLNIAYHEYGCLGRDWTEELGVIDGLETHRVAECRLERRVGMVLIRCRYAASSYRAGMGSMARVQC